MLVFLISTKKIQKSHINHETVLIGYNIILINSDIMLFTALFNALETSNQNKIILNGNQRMLLIIELWYSIIFVLLFNFK